MEHLDVDKLRPSQTSRDDLGLDLHWDGHGVMRDPQ